MRNLFARFGIDGSDISHLERALADSAVQPADMTPAEVEEVQTLLSGVERRKHLSRLHLQYQAIAASIDTLDGADACDSHRWRKRIVEFEVESGERPHSP